MPANLLVSDPSYEWLKSGIPIALQYDLMTAHGLVSGLAADEASASQGGATQVLRTSIESKQGGLHLEASVVDVVSKKVVRVESSDASSASVVLPAVNALAKKLQIDASEFSTKLSPAWQAFTTAQQNGNPQQRAQFLNQAISRDQNFGFAWFSLLEMISPNRLEELKGLLGEAKTHRNAFTPFDQAKFDWALARLTSASPGERIKYAQQVLKLAPNDLEVNAALGNDQILAGDNAAGEQALRRTTALNPTNLNLRFQLARGLMEVRKFKEAEGVLSSMEKTPAVYPELATCLLFEGEKAHADTTFEKFVSTVPTDDLKPLLRGGWDVMTGNTSPGINLVSATKFKDPNFGALALAEVSIWQLMSGNNADVPKTISAMRQVPIQQSPFPLLIGLLADRTTPPLEWQHKVESVGMPEAIKQSLLCYGFFLRGNYNQAAALWQKVLDGTHGSDLRARVMLAASLNKAGKTSEAERIAILPFTPEFNDPYAAISFTELRSLLRK